MVNLRFRVLGNHTFTSCRWRTPIDRLCTRFPAVRSHHSPSLTHAFPFHTVIARPLTMEAALAMDAAGVAHPIDPSFVLLVMFPDFPLGAWRS